MKPYRTCVILLFFMLGFSAQVKAHVELDYPEGGETFIVGQTLIIQWHVAIPHILLNWDLYYSSDGVIWDTLQLNIPPEQLTYEWEVPNELTSLGMIRIWMDNDGQDYVDISGAFTIAPNTMPPHLDAPAHDTIIECSASDQEIAIQNWLNNHGGMEVTNFCGDVVWSHDYTGLNDECGASGSTIVVFTATDECGFVESNAHLTIEDTQPPVISIPASDMIVESDGTGNIPQRSAWLLSSGGAQALDACSNLSWTRDFNGMSDECGATGSATVPFTVHDACGNTDVTIATFTILDRIAPAIILPARDTILECGSGVENAIYQWLNNHAGAHATDVNGNVTWSHNYNGLSDGCGQTGNATVTFTATDECGNQSLTNASLTVGDSAGLHMAILPHDTVINCMDGNAPARVQAWLNNHGGARVADQCGNVTWFNSFPQLPDTCNAPGIYVVSFTAADDCDHFISAQASVTILDSLQTGVAVLSHADFKIYPNPASETLTIEVRNNDPGISHFALFNPFGQAVWSVRSAEKIIQIPVGSFLPGMHILTIYTSQGSQSFKVIVD